MQTEGTSFRILFNIGQLLGRELRVFRFAQNNIDNVGMPRLQIHSALYGTFFNKLTEKIVRSHICLNRSYKHFSTIYVFSSLRTSKLADDYLHAWKRNVEVGRDKCTTKENRFTRQSARIPRAGQSAHGWPIASKRVAGTDRRRTDHRRLDRSFETDVSFFRMIFVCRPILHFTFARHATAVVL